MKKSLLEKFTKKIPRSKRFAVVIFDSKNPPTPGDTITVGEIVFEAKGVPREKLVINGNKIFFTKNYKVKGKIKT